MNYFPSRESSQPTAQTRRRSEATNIGLTTSTPIKKIDHQRSKSCPGAPIKLASLTSRRISLYSTVKRDLMRKFQAAEFIGPPITTDSSSESGLTEEMQGPNQADFYEASTKSAENP
ncbi:unnamed protein product [Closterium sp. NIES-53]